MAKYGAGYEYVLREADEVFQLPEWFMEKYGGIRFSHDYFNCTSRYWTLKVGYMWDGATGIPKWIQQRVIPSFIIPSGFHDMGIQLIRDYGIEIEEDDNHRLFYDACLLAGMPKWIAKIAHFGVKRVGPLLPGSQQHTHRTREAPSLK